MSSSSLMCFLSAASSRPVQPAITSSLGWNAIAPHQVVDHLVEALPGGFAEVVVADDERGAGVELLVLQVAAGELRADQIPRQLVELHALGGAELRRLPVSLELPAQPVVLHHADVGGHLEDAAAAQLAQRVDDL